MFDINPTEISLFDRALDWHSNGHGVALAFVIQTWGSSPRPIGSTMIIRDDMLVEGSVSGGCVESSVIEAGINAIKTNVGRRLNFGVTNETAWNVGLSCGGQIAVLVSPLGFGGVEREVIARFSADTRARRTVTLCLDVEDGKLVHQSSSYMHKSSFFDEASNLFYFVHIPPRRVIIVGGVHITQFLAQMAQLAGYGVTVVDPREVFIVAERFPGIDCVMGWPDEIMPTLELDARTAVVTLTHDAKIDDTSLKVALASNAFYIACLGSPRTHSARCARLSQAGFDTVNLQRLRGPAGLSIGALTPAEIAVSILAEMIAAERMPQLSQ